MNTSALLPFAAILFLTATGCERRSPEVAEKLAELERKNAAATGRQRELEHELEDQKVAAERDAIERERLRLAEDRAVLEREQGEAAAAESEEIRRREGALAKRESSIERTQAELLEKQEELTDQQVKLSERDRTLAGREALAFEVQEQTEPVADYGMFYDSLGSYGSWSDTEDYGYVWQPAVVRDADWRPYSRGRWACSDRGWMWISDEPFGWATYHYGRWTLLRGRGWIWVPGSEWAPSWVSWRENADHIGWAPLPPETLAYRGHAWDSTVDVQFRISPACFTFVEIGYFGGPLAGRCLPISRNGFFFEGTTNITYIHIERNQVICGGPGYQTISDRIRKPLPFYRLEVDSRPRLSRDRLGLRPHIKGDRLVVSAPNIDSARNGSLKPKRVSGRIEETTVERQGTLSREISDSYRRSREESRERAGLPPVAARKEEKPRQQEVNDAPVVERRQDREQPRREIQPQRNPEPLPQNRERQVENTREEPQPQRVAPTNPVLREPQDTEVNHQRQEQTRQAEEALRLQQQEEQARQQRQQEKQQREAEQAREQERTQRREQEQDRERQQRQQEQSQQEERQRESHRQRQQQEDTDRRQEQSRQRQQEENTQRQRQDESRQSKEKEQDETRKKNR